MLKHKVSLKVGESYKQIPRDFAVLDEAGSVLTINSDNFSYLGYNVIKIDFVG